jgi:aspartyl-tRNA(Asn)/glutamyl-tRNA(Gln) amidotransferase subunit A
VEKIRSGELTAEECVSSIYERIRQFEERFHAYVTLTEDQALKTARQIDARRRRGEALGSLAGVCVAVKDNICTQGIRTTCSSRMLEDFIPPYSATVVERIEREDAIIVGKTNMDEFAMGSTTETSYFGLTRNPWDPSRVPGGSSGGSAAAVALDEAVLALGSDTGGSVRCPASFCSVVGLKPTYGLVSRYGLVAFANSLEQIGPITGNVYDCALLLNVIASHDPRDSTSVDVHRKDYTESLEGDIKGLKIGVPKELIGEGTDKSVVSSVWDAVYKLEEFGASYDEVSLPSLEYALPSYYIIAMSEASSNLARYDGLRYGYRAEGSVWSEVYSRGRRTGLGPEVRRRIILGTYALSAGYYEEYYMKALKIRTLIRRDFDRSFEDSDVLVGPTMPLPPFKIGEKIDNPLALYLCDVDTVSVNLMGGCAVSIPCSFVGDLPIGLQIIGKPFDEAKILRVAHAFEQNTTPHLRRPLLKN